MVPAADSISITDIDGNSFTQNKTGCYLHMFLSTSPGRGGAGVAQYPAFPSSQTNLIPSSSENNGIVIGTGTTAVDATDTSLETPIADGIASGEMEHFTCGVGNFATVSTTASFDIERLFRNSSGDAIVINEVGIYSVVTNTATGFETGNPYLRHVCMLRDVLSSGFSVPDGEYLRVVYTISFTA
jgi:hypothetical protein